MTNKTTEQASMCLTLKQIFRLLFNLVDCNEINEKGKGIGEKKRLIEKESANVTISLPNIKLN